MDIDPIKLASITSVTSPRNRGLWLLAFLMLLTLLLVVSARYILPRIARVEVQGSVLALSDIQRMHTQLLEEVQKLEHERAELLVPPRDRLHEALTEERLGMHSLAAMQAAIESQARAMIAQPDTVHISAVRYRPLEKILEIEGDVRFVGQRSIPILARFVASLRQLPFVESIQEPRYARESAKDIGAHSPFIIRIRLS